MIRYFYVTVDEHNVSVKVVSNGEETRDELIIKIKENLREFYMENLELEVHDSQITSIREYFLNAPEGEDLLK